MIFVNEIHYSLCLEKHFNSAWKVSKNGVNLLKLYVLQLQIPGFIFFSSSSFLTVWVMSEDYWLMDTVREEFAK